MLTFFRASFFYNHLSLTMVIIKDGDKNSLTIDTKVGLFRGLSLQSKCGQYHDVCLPTGGIVMLGKTIVTCFWFQRAGLFLRLLRVDVDQPVIPGRPSTTAVNWTAWTALNTLKMIWRASESAITWNRKPPDWSRLPSYIANWSPFLKLDWFGVEF